MKVQLTKKEFHDALVYAAVRKAGMQYPVKHSVHFHGVMIATDMCASPGVTEESPDDMICFTIELEHLPNVTALPIRRKPPKDAG